MKKIVESITRFFREVMQEMKSVAWPTKDDIKEGTIVVIVISGLVAIFLGLVDYGLMNLAVLVFRG